MNIPSQITFYDLLGILVPGFVILWLLNFCGINLNEATTLHWMFIVILSYPIGLTYHKLIEFIAKEIRLTKNTYMLKRTWLEEYGKIYNNDKEKSIEKEYNEAYYRIAKNNCLMNIPVLEGQVTFLRNSIVLLILSAIKINCCYRNYDSFCLSSLLVILVMCNLIMWYFIQNKIYRLVWEGNKYLENLKEK